MAQPTNWSATTLGDRELNLLDNSRWARTQPLADPTSGDVRGAATVEPAEGDPSPLWIHGVDWTRQDHTRLRHGLGGSYARYERAAAQLANDLVALRPDGGQLVDLIALVVYREQREAIDAALRTGPSDDWSTLIARGAAHGLRYLPVEVGPLFAVGAPQLDLSRYEFGSTVVEPAFVEMSRHRGPAPDAEFVVWSVTARRYGRESTSLFTAGNPFHVLAVDPAPRVLLLDAATDRLIPSATSRIADRLRRLPVDTHQPPARLAFAPGLDDRGRPFPLPGLARQERQGAPMWKGA